MLTRTAPLIGLAAFTVAAHAAEPPRPGSVVLAGAMSDPDLVAVSAAAAAAPDTTFLMDSPRAETVVRPFLERYRPDRLTPVGGFPEGHDPARRWGVAEPAAPLDPGAFVWSAFPKAERVVVAPRAPAAQLLQAACLAGAMRAPLVLLRDGDDPLATLREQAAARGVREVFAVGAAADPARALLGVKVTLLPDASAVARAHRQELLRGGRIDVLVLANPADLKGAAALAPYAAVRRRAALLLTGPDGKDAGAVVAAALKDPLLATADALLVLGDLNAIPVAKRPNPAQGKDQEIDVEPWLPAGDELITLSAGRLFHADRAVVPLVLAREALWARSPGPPKVFMASNPGGGLPLLETFSRHTARELANAGYRVTARYENEVNPQEVRTQLPRNDVFLWEGHYRTLIDDYGMPKWTEQFPPNLVFLQSCLALNPDEAGLLFDRGAVAVVGSPNRTYSGSGGAYTLAFFDALAYDGRPVGAAMRHAKNFLLAYAELKAKRLGDAAELGGANRRAAWTFTLWGDPTVKLPPAAPPPDALPRVRAEGQRTAITVKLPEQKYPVLARPPYRAVLWPGGRLAGLLTPEAEDSKRLVPMAFAEVLLEGPKGQVPRLSSKVPGRNWVFRWDARRRVGYLLVLPREKDEGEVAFRVHWERPDAGE